MARGISRQDLKHDEFIDKATEAGHWLEEHWRLVAAIVGAIFVLVLAYALWNWNAARNAAAAAETLSSGVGHFQLAEETGFAAQGELESALDDFTTAADRAGGGVTGLSARYWRAAALHRLGRTDEAIPILDGLLEATGTPATLSGAARQLLATLEAETGDLDAAIALLEAAADGSTALPAELALLQLGSLQQRAGRPDDARATWQRVIDEHPQTGAAQEARRLLGS